MLSKRSRLRVLVSIWFQVLFHRPHRAAFHLSLTVLVHYRSEDVFSLARLGLPDSRGAVVPRVTQEEQREVERIFAYGTIALFGRPFQDVRLTNSHVNSF